MQLPVNGKMFVVAIALIGASILMAPSVVASDLSAKSPPSELRAYVRAIDEKIKAEPNVAKNYGLKGQALEQLGDHAGAVAAFTRKLELVPNDPVGLFRRAENYRLMKRTHEAEADYNNLVNRGVEGSPIFSGRAIVRSLLNDLTGALSDSEKAIKLDRMDPQAWFAKGCVLYDMKSHDRGLSCFSESIRLDPSIKQSWSMRSKANAALGRLKESQSDLSRANLLGPKRI